MIDEFQDNNELQKDLLYLLAERDGESADGIPASDSLAVDKLFFVGDEKQSIYRFRGADVSVFKRLSAELASANDSGSGSNSGSGSGEIVLSSNYRSAARLIGFFNDFFSAVMPRGGEAARDFAASYTAMIPGPAETGRADNPFPSQIKYYLDETGGGLGGRGSCRRRRRRGCRRRRGLRLPTMPSKISPTQTPPARSLSTQTTISLSRSPASSGANPAPSNSAPAAPTAPRRLERPVMAISPSSSARPPTSTALKSISASSAFPLNRRAREASSGSRRRTTCIPCSR